MGDQNGIAASLQNIGSIFRDQGDNSKAMDYFTQSLNIYEQIGDQNGIAEVHINLGIGHRSQGDFEEALGHCQKGYEIALSTGTLSDQKNACHCLYETYKVKGVGIKALEFHEQWVVLNDSIYNERNTKRITQLEMQYEFDKKEAASILEQEKKEAIATQKLKRQKLMRNGFVVGFAVMLLFAGVFYCSAQSHWKGDAT